MTRRAGNRLGTIFFAALLFFQGCAEDLALPPAETYPAWEMVGVPPLDLSVFAMTKGPGGELIVGGQSGRYGIFISRDDGESWERGGAGLNPSSSMSSVVCGDEGCLYAGFDPGGVFLSRDWGKNWTQMNDRLTDIYITDLAVTSSGKILASTAHGIIFSSCDNASSWTALDTLGQNPYDPVRDLFISARGAVYAACGSDRIYMSEDDGSTWATVEHGQQGLEEVLCFAEDGAGSILASTRSGIIMKSGEPGMPWTIIHPGSMEDSYIFQIAVDEAGRIFAWPLWTGLIVSEDGGTSWEVVENTDRWGSPAAMIAVDGSFFVGTAWEGLYRSRDHGETWHSIGWDPSTTIHDIAVDGSGVIFVYSREGMFRWDDDGKGWIKIDGNFSRYSNSTIDVDPAGALYFAVPYIYRSSDRDGDWILMEADGWEDVYALDIAGEGIVFAATDAGIARSSGGGDPFILVNEDILEAYLILAAGGGRVFAVDDYGVHMSIDDGSGWKRVLVKNNVYSIEIDEEENVYVASLDGIMISSDTCATWTAVDVGISNEVPKQVIALPDSRIIAITSWGRILISGIGGMDWVEFKTGSSACGSEYYVSSEGCLYNFGVGMQRLCADELGKL